MKKKVSLLMALCMLMMFALTACADDATVDDDVTIGESPTSTVVPGNGTTVNDNLTVTPRP